MRTMGVLSALTRIRTDAHGQWRTVAFAHVGNLVTFPGEWVRFYFVEK